MVVKIVKRIIRRIHDATGWRWETDIVGKKVSIIKLCEEGRLHPRKCRKYIEL